MAEYGVNTQDPSLSRTFRGQLSAVHSVAYTTSQNQVFSGSADGSIMVWNFKPQHRAYRLRGHKGCVHALDVAPDERIFASGSADHTVRLWKPSVQGAHLSFRAHNGGVTSVKFSVDSSLLLTASTDKMVKLWDVTTGALASGKRPKFLWCVHGHNNWVRSADISLNSLLVCSGGEDKIVKVWDATTAAEVCSFDDHVAPVRSVQFDPLMAVCVASAGDDATINLWDIRTQHVAQHYSLPQQGSGITSIRFHPSGNYLLSSSQDGAVRVWDLREGRPLLSILAHTQSANAVAFSPDGEHFLSGSSDHFVLAWKCDSLCKNLDSGGVDDAAVVEDLARATKAMTISSSRHRHKHSHKEKTHKRSHSKKHHRKQPKKLDMTEMEMALAADGGTQPEHTSSHRHHSSNRHKHSHNDESGNGKHHSRRHFTKSSRNSSKQGHGIFDNGVEEVEGNFEQVAHRNSVEETFDAKSANLGEYTRAAILASMRRKTNSEDSDSMAGSAPLHPPTEQPPQLSAKQVDTLARAMNNLEQRLRMNEDAVADLRSSARPK